MLEFYRKLDCAPEHIEKQLNAYTDTVRKRWAVITRLEEQGRITETESSKLKTGVIEDWGALVLFAAIFGFSYEIKKRRWASLEERPVTRGIYAYAAGIDLDKSLPRNTADKSKGGTQR